MRFRFILAAASLAILTACSSDVPQSVIDQNMQISYNNAQKNANSYFAIVWPEGTVDSITRSKPMRALMQSDSSISKSCRYGDGWASGVIQFENGKSQKIKCQTNGVGKGINGCLTEQEFNTKDYKNDDGKCMNLESLEKFK